MRVRSAIGVISLLFAVSLPAADLAEFTRVLVPMNIALVHGPAGTSWSSRLVLWNGSLRPLTIFPSFRSDTTAIAPESAIEFPISPNPTGAPPGSFVYIPTTAVREVALRSEVFTETPQGRDLGTEIPIVREADTRTDVLRLIPIEIDPGSRVRLRIYDWDGLAEARALVRVIRPDRREVMVEELVTLHAQPIPGFDTYPLAPGYSEWTNFPPSVPGRQPDAAWVRVEIVPLTPHLRLWAFATITSNETQRFTIVTPQ